MGDDNAAGMKKDVIVGYVTHTHTHTSTKSTLIDLIQTQCPVILSTKEVINSGQIINTKIKKRLLFTAHNGEWWSSS